MTRHWSLWKALKWGWGQELTSWGRGEHLDPNYREPGNSWWGYLEVAPAGWLMGVLGPGGRRAPQDQAAAVLAAGPGLPFPATGQGKPLSISSRSHSNGPSAKPTHFCW